jgi:hypothetical protein
MRAAILGSQRQRRGQRETWLFWMAADLVYIPLYSAKRLDVTGGNAPVPVTGCGRCLAVGDVEDADDPIRDLVRDPV